MSIFSILSSLCRRLYAEHLKRKWNQRCHQAPFPEWFQATIFSSRWANNIDIKKLLVFWNSCIAVIIAFTKIIYKIVALSNSMTFRQCTTTWEIHWKEQATQLSGFMYHLHCRICFKTVLIIWKGYMHVHRLSTGCACKVHLLHPETLKTFSFFSALPPKKHSCVIVNIIDRITLTGM